MENIRDDVVKAAGCRSRLVSRAALKFVGREIKKAGIGKSGQRKPDFSRQNERKL